MANLPNTPGQRARIDARYPDQPVRRHPVVEPPDTAEIARRGHILTHHTAHRMRPVGLDILGIGADIADMGESEGDNLPGIGGISHHLLIAGHRGVKAQLAHARADPAKAPAPQDAAIAEDKRASGPGGR
jgi:hypothetical protein